ncbi:MAG: hypothetical protein Q4D90_04690 [bacterium]|nr:hypothetical protein [bacterium]
MRTDHRLRICLLGMGLLVWGLCLFCAYRLFGVGTLSWHIVQPETLWLYGELSLLFLLLFGALSQKNVWRRIALCLFLLLGFFWIHAIFLPMVFAACYLCFLYYLGLVGLWALTGKRGGQPAVLYAVFGAVFVILIFCFLSVFQIGGARKQLFLLALLGLPLAVWVLWGWFRKREQLLRKIASWQLSKKEAALLALLTVLICLQAGRMNIAVDYDSLWYGLRSEYVLDNGRGIYENLGLLGVVYTYSKAWEILLLPFAALPSHAFVLAFGVYVTAAALWLLYESAKLWMPKREACWALLLMAAIPAVMNMAISAKTDAATLLLQLLLFYFLLHSTLTTHAGRQVSTQEAAQDWIWALCLLLLSFTLKPTSIVFSTAVFGMSFLYALMQKRFFLPRRARSYLVLLPVLLEVFAVFARTWRLTGVPLTSVYTSLFQKLGFSVKYPFEIPEAESLRASSLSGLEKAERFGKRLYGIFVCPEDKVDMAHVIFAWGGLFFVVFLLLAFFWLLFCRQKGERAKFFRGGYLAWVLVPVTLGSLYVLYQLTQIDGNYYNFPYVLAVFAGCYGISRLREERWRSVWHGLLLPPLVLGIVLSSVTNWDWQIGLNPISLKHKGFYNHEQAEREKMAEGEFSCAGIWHILAANPRARMISLGEHPDTLLFPCSVQSYGDIAGSWGNATVVESVEKFRRFVSYAKTDYVYIQANYMCRWEDPYGLICKLIYEGVLTELVFENGNVLAKVNPQGEHDERATAYLEEFSYIYHPADWPQRLQ